MAANTDPRDPLEVSRGAVGKSTVGDATGVFNTARPVGAEFTDLTGVDSGAKRSSTPATARRANTMITASELRSQLGTISASLNQVRSGT